MRTHSLQFLPLLLAALALQTAPDRLTSTTYRLTDLGTLGTPGTYSFSAAYCINAAGQIGGISTASTIPPTSPAFLYANGKMTSLGTLGGATAKAQGINTIGQLAGYSTLSNGHYRAFLYSNGSMINIGTLGQDYSVGYAVNASGTVVGDSQNAAGKDHAFLYSGGKMTDLGTLGGDTSTAAGINSAGQIVGYSYAADGNFRAFLYNKGSMIDLGTLGGDWSVATSINDAGQITGQAYTPGNIGANAFIYDQGKMTSIGLLGGNYSIGNSINSSRQVVGRSTIHSNGQFLVYHAFVYSSGQMRDLNKLIPSGTGFVLEDATAINDSGQIVGYGTAQGQMHAFLLTPQ